ncbi:MULTISPECIES: non-homologous end-joining DNA ligase [unclassified Luteococcus]|uniref:non-homologous end-joining DNA ligase n=1 Tax=unclassified Luteococcus TaxID=2639923 RepID=UPI00313E2E6B
MNLPPELPAWEPMLATLGSIDAVAGHPRDYHYEVKWDGYRGVASCGDAAGMRLRSRGGLDLLASYPELAELRGLVAGHRAVLDGEIVALTDSGVSDFEALQNHGQPGARSAHYMLFDLLHLDGHDLLEVPYLARRDLLTSLIDEGSPHVHVPSTFGDQLDVARQASVQLRLEGLIAKRITSGYQPGSRSPYWLKVKNFYTQEVVVVGWSRGSGNRSGGLGSLLLAVPGDDGSLHCVGSAGSGFSAAALDQALSRLAPLAVPANPGVLGVRPAEARVVTWVRPELAGEVSYGMWTSAGRLRHPVWRGWRDDLDPSQIRRDVG